MSESFISRSTALGFFPFISERYIYIYMCVCVCMYLIFWIYRGNLGVCSGNIDVSFVT